MSRHTLVRVSLLVCLIGALVAPTATAQATGNMNVSVDIPSLVILWYYGDVNVDISAADLAGVLVSGASGNAAVNLGAALDQPAFTPDLAINPTLDGDPTSVGLELRNTWAVLSIGRGGGGGTEVSVTLTNDTLTGPVGNTLTLANVRAQSPSSGGAGSTINFPPTGFTGRETGDVLVDLDLSQASVEGAYTGGQITITATNL